MTEAQPNFRSVELKPFVPSRDFEPSQGDPSGVCWQVARNTD